jgi:hypothetical protein
MAFPTLFPDGAGDFYQARLRKVDVGEYFKHLLRFGGEQPAQKIFVVRIKYPTTSQDTELVKGERRLTAADTRAMLSESDQIIVNQMIRYGTNLRGTPVGMS